MTDEPVAWLIIRTAHDDPDSTYGRIEICGNEQLFLGRDPETCRYCWSDDLSISRQHLRIHCILYEQDPESSVAPFVYATDISANGTYLKKSNEECTSFQRCGVLMGRGNTLLLDDGDELHISDTVRLVYCASRPVQKVRFPGVQEREKAVFASRYLVTSRLIGEGGYGKVLVATQQASQRQLACKIVRLDSLYGNKSPFPHSQLPSVGVQNCQVKTGVQWPPRVAACFREFQILEQINHPNIVTLEKVFWSHRSIYIFQELVTGGDLFSFLEYKGGHLETPLAAVIVRQILTGIEYLHSRDIVHRDLKPDNILLTSLEDGARIVITDFGNARFVPEAQSQYTQRADKYCRMFSYVGTLEFAAPEIHHANPAIPTDQGYSRSVDMWSIGSITGTLLSGDAMFTDRSHPDYQKNPREVIMGLAAQCDLSVLDDEDHPIWSRIGHRPKDFIKKLLVLKDDKRMTAAQALVHDWFSNRLHARSFDDVYARATTGWKPRDKVEQLVERISKGISKVAPIYEDAKFYRQKAPNNSELGQQSLPILDPPIATPSQQWRANTPLGSPINDDIDALFASQTRPLSLQKNRSSGNQHNSFALEGPIRGNDISHHPNFEQSSEVSEQQSFQETLNLDEQFTEQELSYEKPSDEDHGYSVHVHWSQFDPGQAQSLHAVHKRQHVADICDEDAEPSIVYETPDIHATCTGLQSCE